MLWRGEIRTGAAITLTIVFLLLGQSTYRPAQGAGVQPKDGMLGNAGLQRQQAVIRYVATGGDDASTCTSASAPCRTVQHAVDAAQQGDVIRVAAGTYTEPDIVDIGYVLVLTKTVSLQGGFPPTLDGPPDPEQHATILDAQGQGRVIHISGGAPCIEGFVITGGFGDYSGGGVRIENADATLIGNHIVGNHAEGDGGGIFANRSSVQIVDNLIFSNTATWAGGLRIINDSAALVVGNRIEGNVARSAGGGIDIGCCGNAVAVVERNTIVNNTGGSRGGGVIVGDTHARLANNFIAANTAGSGAALYADGQAGYPSHLDIVHNTFAGTRDGGVGIWTEEYVTATLANNILLNFTVAITNNTPLSATVVADHNLFHANALDTSPGVISVAAFHGDPLFAAPALLDFHLQSGSPAIDKGLNGLAADDIDKEPRMAKPDLGADEYWPPGTMFFHVYLPAISGP